MFGYVRPAGRLPEQDRQMFAAAYCGLCGALGARYGLAARWVLNYDFVFLAALLWPPDVPVELAPRRCPAHPLHRRPCCQDNPALALAAGYSVILTWQQLGDKLADPGGGKAGPRAARRLLRPAYERARGEREGFNRAVESRLAELHALEESRCPSLDRPAHAFAELLSGAAAEVQSPSRRRVLEQILYHLGRWIYLIDAADDLPGDFLSGSYNPLVCRYGLTDGVLTGEAKASLAATLDHSIRLMAAAYELENFGPWSGLIQSVLYEGLFGVGRAVLDGTFHQDHKDRSRPDRSEVQL